MYAEQLGIHGSGHKANLMQSIIDEHVFIGLAIMVCIRTPQVECEREARFQISSPKSEE